MSEVIIKGILIIFFCLVLLAVDKYSIQPGLDELDAGILELKKDVEIDNKNN